MKSACNTQRLQRRTPSPDAASMDTETQPSGRPTLADLTSDNHFAIVARKHWLTKAPQKVQANVIDTELWTTLESDNFSQFSLLLLEQLQALERYLWPGYTDDASNHHVLLLALLTNVKRQEQFPTWTLFADRPDAFQSFFHRVLQLTLDRSIGTSLRTHLLAFIVGAFDSLDNGLVRKECAPLVGIGIWHNLHSEEARDRRLATSAQLQKAARAAEKKFNTADTAGQANLKFDRNWLYTLILDFFDKLYDADASDDQKSENTLYCERFMELLCDLESQLPTRRYVNALLQDLNVLPVLRLSPLHDDSGKSTLLRGLVALLEYYMCFPISDHSGQQMSRQEYEEAHNHQLAALQKVAMKCFPEKLKILVLASYGILGQRNELSGHLKSLTDTETLKLCSELGFRTAYSTSSLVFRDRTLFMSILLHNFGKTPYLSDHFNQEISVLPTEETLYDTALPQTDTYNNSRPLALPKLNLQYLTIGDFLHRSYILFRNEAFYEIRNHIEDIMKRLKPSRQGGTTRFDGFSRMAIPIAKPAIIDTLPPHVGQDFPAEVKAEVVLDVSRLQPGLRREWESLRPGDVVYLIAVHANEMALHLTNSRQQTSVADNIGLQYLRCAEVLHVLDDSGRLLKQDTDRQDHSNGEARIRQRRLLLRLDPVAYKSDKERADSSKGDVYESINLIVRRRARENNFKPVLETIRQLAISDSPIPSWLQEVFLGYGDPASATYKRLSNRLKKVDYRDTFLDWQHLIESLPGSTVEPDPSLDGSFPPPYILESTQAEAAPASRPSKKRRREQPEVLPASTESNIETFQVSTYQPLNTGPYPSDMPKLNLIRFTPAQIEAVTSGTQPGLTLIVGPPGTGKTDVATQIINNIYHNFPHQRTLLIAHSNQALNQLFQKIMALDIDQRHLLRLGHGEDELETEASFSKAGRVESFLDRGNYYLAEVQRLAGSIGAPGAHGNSCETAEYFNHVWIQPRWRRFWDEIDGATVEQIMAKFPFFDFFIDLPRPLFPTDASKTDVVGIVKGCERHIRRIFDELADIRPFEILRSQRDKSNYLLVKEARIVAMTSTHAGMRRQEIAGLGFHYDNVIMEEAAQVTEIENFIPLVMQNPHIKGSQSPQSQLQRIILVGDHLQNAPVIQNLALRSQANLQQSLFQRLMRLGVPHILLDAQGRSRPSIAALYQWRYPHLRSLPFTSTLPEFVQANAGFRHEYQFIDVPDYKGRGESEPTPHFLQNLGEAEYAVALYQYMRLLGYPASKITILCTYAGQRALLRDVLAHRCKGNRLFGMPAWVGTVDKYQGEQNDYVILSLVRTKTPGYLRDLRRLTVALSRARLGLYVLGRRAVFESSLELRDAFALLLERSSRLELVTNEMFPATRTSGIDVEATEMEGVEHLGQYVYEMTQAKVQALKSGRDEIPAVETTNGENGVGGEDEVEDEDDDQGRTGEDYEAGDEATGS